MVQGFKHPAPLGVHSKRFKRPPSIENEFLFWMEFEEGQFTSSIEK